MPTGTYRVATDEELIEELSFSFYPRASTMIFVLADSVFSDGGLYPQDLQAAQQRPKSCLVFPDQSSFWSPLFCW
ncbi:MAG TPA: hypothetical protein VFD98_08835 [Terracidiphilus sp.]|jgi:hypothetical protein|nr:hypothetical protein [Terracidiphilus sp.]